MKRSAIDTLKRYLKVYAAYLRFAYISLMTYRASFLIELVIELGYVAWLIVFYEVIFANIEEIGGWNKYEVLVLIGLGILFNELMTGLFFVWNTRMIPERVRTGDMDILLLKPLDSQFALTAMQVYPSSLPTSLIGLYLVVTAIPHLDTHLSLLNVLASALIFMSGMVIGYAILTFISSFAIVFVNANFLTQLPYEVFQFGKKPHTIYFGVLKFIFFFIIPIVFIASVPADVLVRGATLWYVPLSMLMAAISFIIAQKT